MADRSPNLQRFLDAFAEEHGISEEFIAASDHPWNCRCDACRDWWRQMGPDPDTGSYGPFTKEEIESNG